MVASLPEQVSFKDALRNREMRTEPSMRYFASCYDEGSVSDDEEVNPEKEDLLCHTITLTKAEKIRLRSPWKKNLDY